MARLGFAPRDDRSSKNEPKRVEIHRDTTVLKSWDVSHAFPAQVYRGAGLSVGSVHPSTKKPCVSGVRFEDIALYGPLKGPYVKPDLGAATATASRSTTARRSSRTSPTRASR